MFRDLNLEENPIKLLVGNYQEVNDTAILSEQTRRITAVLIELNKKHLIGDTFFTEHVEDNVNPKKLLSPRIKRFFGFNDNVDQLMRWRSAVVTGATEVETSIVGEPRRRKAAIERSVGGSASASTGRRKFTKKHRRTHIKKTRHRRHNR